MNAERALEREIDRISFAMDELRLFLDTHPRDTKALAAVSELGKKRRESIERYRELYGPLDAYSAGGSEVWNWLRQPWPWEKEA